MAKRKTRRKRAKVSRVKTKISASTHRKLNAALRDVFGRSPKTLSVEFNRTAKGLRGAAIDDDGGWSGNVYKYSF